MVFYYGYYYVLEHLGMICPIGTYPSPYQTCHHRRFQQWVRTGIFEQVLHGLATDLHKRGGLDLSERYIDGGTFIVAKKEGGNEIGETKRGKGTKKLMAISDSTGLRISVYVTSTASPHNEVTFAEATISAKCFVTDEKPERLIGEYKAYDNDLDERLAIEYGIEMISPHRGGWRRKRPKKTQDGRPLRRYKHRWKVERLFAWLQNFHRILVRYEYHAENYLGFA
jgi:transposase